jgi:hypothetical protein
VDPFVIVILGALVALVLWVWLLGKYVPGSGMEQLGLRSGRQIMEDREELEAEDLSQMIAAHNERRRRRGKSEITVADIEQQVMEDFGEQRRRRAAYQADRDLDELLEATNARRRARGLPERTREEVQREFGSGGQAEPAADTGPRADSGPRAADTGPRAADTAPRAADTGPRATDTGPRAAE